MPLADPWQDYLALPLGPLILLAQLGSVFVGTRISRWAIGLGCLAVLMVMFFYVVSLDVEGEGANIGAGVLLLWVLCSIGLLFVAGLREAVGAVARRLRH